MSRVYCKACRRLESHCLCDALIDIDNHIPTLFLQHPNEKGHVKNTAWLTHQCLKNSRFETGEVFDSCFLETLLKPNSFLLYPQTDDFDGEMIQSEHLLGRFSDMQLVVLDGTWRKTRKMLYLNPALAALPRIEMAPQYVSAYKIRKQKKAFGLSTLEAVQQMLAALEGNAEKYHSLLNVLNALVEQQLKYRSINETARM